jgi:hypothetical protein
MTQLNFYVHLSNSLTHFDKTLYTALRLYEYSYVEVPISIQFNPFKSHLNI